MPSHDEYLKRILKSRVYEVAQETPLDPAPRLSKRLGSEVLFKREDLQPVFSFKLRGAYNKLVRLTHEETSAGVICSSAGNHAQGVALAARQLGIRAVIVMPTRTASIKVDAVRELGGEVVLSGDTYDDAYQAALAQAGAEGLTFVHPFDDPDVIAGQGTIAMEVLRQRPGNIDAIFVPVGGGGLIAGIALYAKALFPGIRIIGVEPEESAGMHASLAAGKPVTLERVGIFADGAAVRRVGDETFRICRELVDEIVLVTTDEICAAIKDIFDDSRAIMEPAGALAVAGLKKWLEAPARRGGSFVTINGGANINFDRLRHVVERAALGEQREALFAVEIPEKPGSFRAFCEAVGKRNITEFNYRYGDTSRARIFVGIELSRGAAERAEFAARMDSGGYPAIDLSDDEMTKLHIRHMVGGLAPGIRDERIYRFEFPERSGALLDFLRAVGDRWNITLFHYRNHGSDYGRVLIGIQVPDDERGDYERHLEALGYPFRDETGSPAYRAFLSGNGQ